MTICEVYVGDLKDPCFKWAGGNWNCNIPGRLSPIFPPLPGSYNSTFETWVSSTGVVSRQTDFGGQVAQVTRSHIIDFIAQSYRGERSQEAQARINDLSDFVNTLEEDQLYALVATEW